MQRARSEGPSCNTDPSEHQRRPSHFYKIILAPRHDLFWDTISFLLPHQQHTQNSDATLTNAIVSIDDVEALTGIDFLTAIAAQDAGREQAIEGFAAAGLWER